MNCIERTEVILADVKRARKEYMYTQIAKSEARHQVMAALRAVHRQMKRSVRRNRQEERANSRLLVVDMSDGIFSRGPQFNTIQPHGDINSFYPSVKDIRSPEPLES